MFNEFRDAPDTKPANHLRRNFISDEIGEKRRMVLVRFDCAGYRTSDFPTRGLIAQEFNVLCPWQCDEDTQLRRGARIEEPERRRVVNAKHIKAECANVREISGNPFRRTEVIASRVRLERPVGNAFDEEFAVVFEEEFCDGADWIRGIGAHSGCYLD